MGNSGQPQFSEQLTGWAKGEDAVLAEAAQWALERLRTASRLTEDEAESLEQALDGSLPQ